MGTKNIAAMWAAGISIAALAVPAQAQAQAQAQAREYRIPSGTLRSALDAYARQSGRQVLYKTDDVVRVRSRGATGSFDAAAALDAVLSGTGFSARTDSSGAIAIVRTVTSQLTSDTSAPDAAQSGDAGEDSAEILVTGSRIARQVQTDSPVPIVAINEEDIQAAGSQELSEILADYPAVTPGLNLANSNSQINGAGTSTISLRSLGTNRTLTLIDGRRAVSNSITSNAVSLSTIPTFFVDRVEIVTGGASAIYGSDAIAGVVNVITRRNFEGLRLGARYGFSPEGGAQRANLTGLAGFKFFGGRGSLIVGAEYEKEEGLMGRDRAYALDSVSYSQTADANPLNQGNLGITRPARSSSVPGGRFLSSTAPGYFYYDANGNLARSTSSAVYGYETRPDLQISAPRESKLFAAKFDFEFSPSVNFFAQAQFSDIDTVAARGGADTIAYDEVFGLSDEREVGRIPRNNPFVPAQIRALASSSGVQFSRRLTELGNYEVVNDRDTWRAAAGFNGSFGKDWRWELSYGYGRFRQDQDRTNLVNFENFQQAIQAEYDPAFPGDLSRVRCISATARAAGCVPINIFGPNSITPAAADYIRTTMRTIGIVRQDVVQGYLAGSLFELPAGPLSVAVGAEYRHDWQNTVTDDVTRRNIASASFIAEYEGSITAKEAFVELNVPLLKDIPLIQSLSLDAAARYGKYDIRNVGSVFSYRLGGEWTPVNGLRFRGQFSRAQRAPTVTNLYSPARDDADEVADLCSGVRATTVGTIAANCRSIPSVAAQIAANGVFTQTTEDIAGPSSGNINLKEETADTITLGGVLTPAILPGFSLAVDYFDIKVKDAIGSLDGDTILRECLANPSGITNNFFCGEVTRNPTSGQITRILNRDLNLDQITRSGIDFALDYRFDTPAWLSQTAKIDVRLLYSRLLNFYTVFQGVDGVRRSEAKGEVGSWVNQGQAQIGYKNEGFSLRWKARYTGKAVDSLERLAIAQAAGSNPPFLHIDASWRHDFYASLEIPSEKGKLRLYAGVNNAFDKISPFLPSGTDSGSSQNISGEYDVIGRYLYIGAELKF